jgi:hypothetical protein
LGNYRHGKGVESGHCLKMVEFVHNNDWGESRVWPTGLWDWKTIGYLWFQRTPVGRKSWIPKIITFFSEDKVRLM